MFSSDKCKVLHFGKLYTSWTFTVNGRALVSVEEEGTSMQFPESGITVRYCGEDGI